MGEIKAELNAELQTHIAFEIPLFGGIPVPESAVVSWAIIVVLTLLAIWLTHGLRKRPGRRQIAAARSMCKGQPAWVWASSSGRKSTWILAPTPDSFSTRVS